MSSTLYRKYRPQTWSDIAGQAHVKDTLAFEVASGQLAHAYLLAGPRGVGKTTTARIFAKAVNCLNRQPGSGEPCNECESCRAVTEGGSLDIIEIDAASHTGVDAVRENIVENARFSPARLKNKVFIIDEVHMLSTSAFNALLKTLEEPPPNVLFMLATTELHKIPATVISRCQRFDFRKISVVDVIERLKKIAVSEKVKVDESVLAEIARLSEGGLRDAEGLFGKLLAVTDGKKKITDKDAALVLPRSDWETAAKFVDALVAGETDKALAAVGECLENGADMEQFAGEIIELLRKGMLVKLAGNTTAFKTELDESRLARVAGWAKAADLAFLVRALEIMLAKRRELKGSHPLQLPLELAAVLIIEQPNVSAVGRSIEGNAMVRSGFAKPQEVARAPHQIDVQTSVAVNLTQQSVVENHADKKTDTSSRQPERREQSAEPQSEKSAQVESTTLSSDVEPVTNIEELKQIWGNLISKVSEVSPSLTLLLGAVTPVGVCGHKISIGSSFSYYKEKLNEDKTRLVLEEALSGTLGKKVLVEGVTLEKNEQVMHNNVAEVQFANSPMKSSLTTVSVEPADNIAKLAATFEGQIIT
ncbi:MAG: DNA polymerase III subunit gamma/tau [Patescibacteria group bacterium]